MSLVGPSGSGKSSLLRAIIGLQQPIEGSIESQLDPTEIGILFQDDALLPWRNARDNVALGLGFHGMGRAEMVALARGLDDALKAMPKMKPEDMVGALPKELVAGANVAELADVLRKYSASLYPDTVTIELASSRRVADMLKTAGLIKPDADVTALHDTTIVGG